MGGSLGAVGPCPGLRSAVQTALPWLSWGWTTGPPETPCGPLQSLCAGTLRPGAVRWDSTGFSREDLGTSILKGTPSKRAEAVPRAPCMGEAGWSLVPTTGLICLRLAGGLALTCF